MGGVEIPYEKGLLGHSDADVLTHAVMDALLGAAAPGRYWNMVSDTDPAYSGADSLALLRQVVPYLAETWLPDCKYRRDGFGPGTKAQALY